MDIGLDAKLYRALTEKNESEVLTLCQTLPTNDGPMHVVTIHKDSVLHVALHSMQVKLVSNLLAMSYNRNLLVRANAVGNTVLHEAATHDEFLSVAKNLLELQPQLLNVQNKNSETPLFSAARYGQMKMFKFLDEKLYRNMGYESAKKVHVKDDGSTILHAAIDAEHFQLAFWIASKHKHLHHKKNYDGLTALQLLACNPLAFQFRSKGWLKIFIDTHYSVPWWGEMLRKRRYNVVVNLAKLLIENDTSWKATQSVGTPDAKTSADKENDEKSADKENDESTVVDSKNGEKNIEAELKKIGAQLQKTDQDELKKIEAKKKKAERQQIPLLLATQTGCFEIVEEILKLHPQAVEHIDKKGRSILHIAIRYRQMVIFDSVLKTMEVHMRRLIRKCDLKGNSILHMVGKKIRNEDVVQTQKRSPAFYLQKDMLLFERVKKIMSPHFYKNINHEGNTAEQLFAANSKKLRVMSEEWLKRRAGNCSALAVSIAVAAFAAAYTIPGGTKENGSLALLNHSFFDLFTFSIVLSLTFTLTAGVMFLSILTSSFQLEDFKHWLPLKLMLGFTCLMLSVFTMISAFSSTIILTIHKKQFMMRIALYMFSFLPFTILACVYMPLYLWMMGTFKYTLMEIGSYFPRSNEIEAEDDDDVPIEISASDLV